MQNKSHLAYAMATGVAIALLTTPAIARKAQRSDEMNNSQFQTASSSYASVPQSNLNTLRSGRCWIATDESRPYGYAASCANPLARNPGLDPFYNPEW